MARREQNPEQIVRIDGKNCFLEVMSNSFAIGKVRINFRQYDMNASQGNRTTGKIDVYLGFKDFDYIYQGILHNGNGYLLNEVYNNQYGATIYRGGKKDNNGNIIARELKLQVGQKKPFVLIAEEGPGNENRMGGFSIIRGNNANIKKVMIPLEFADIVNICVSTNNSIIAYRAATEVKKTLDFEFGKVKDLLSQIAMSVGCDQNVIAEIINREMPRTWGNDNNGNSDNYNNGGSYNNSSNYNNGNYGGGYNSQQNQGYDNYYGGSSDYYANSGSYGGGYGGNYN